MGESHAIMRYLAMSRQVADHWYPKDLRKRAKVDEYLDMHHTYLRQGSGAYIFKKLFAPVVINKTYKEEELDFHKIMLGRSLKNLENRLSENPYLCGAEISIADLSAAHELDQTRFLELDLAKWPKTKEWLHKIIDEDPIQREISLPMRKLAAMSVEKQKKAVTPKL